MESEHGGAERKDEACPGARPEAESNFFAHF